MDSIDIPLAVVELVDNGGDPSSYSKHLIEKASNDNDQLRGNLFAIKAIHDWTKQNNDTFNENNARTTKTKDNIQEEGNGMQI